MLKRMIFESMTYDMNPVSITYSEDELRTLIEDFVNKQDNEFSYKIVCHHILGKAKEEGKVPNADNTQYSSNELNPWSGAIVSKIIWEMIWDRKVFIAFGSNPYRGGYPDDVRLWKYEKE